MKEIVQNETEQADQFAKEQIVAAMVGEFIKGKSSVLLDAEFVSKFIVYLLLLVEQQNDDKVKAILRSLGETALSSDQTLRERAVMVLSLLTEKLLAKENTDLLRLSSNLLVGWLEKEHVFLSGFELLCRQITAIGLFLLDKEQWQDAWYLLITLQGIGQGKIAKSAAIRKVVVKTQEGIAKKEALEKLYSLFVEESGRKKDTIQDILLGLGKRALVFLTNQLMHSKNKEERLRLAALLPAAGTEIVPILEDCLAQKPVWYVIRNIISIFATLDAQSYLNIIEPYLQHPDLRVQLEALDYLLKQSPELVREKLLAAVEKSRVELLPHLIRRLAVYNDKQVAETFSRLLHRWHSFPPHLLEIIFPYIVHAIQSFPARKDVTILQDIAANKLDNPSEKKVAQQAATALRSITPSLRHLERSENERATIPLVQDQGTVVFQSDQILRKLEDELSLLLQKKNINAATDLIYTRCVEAARAKDFTVAEALRDRMLEINPYALNKMIQLSEILEEEKSTSISREYIDLWENLFDRMTTEEFNEMYYAFRQEKYAKGETLVKEGDIDPKLYFIQSGVVKLSCKTGPGTTFLKKLKAGDIHGGDQFFSVSVWTTTMVAQEETTIQYLDRDSMSGLDAKFPGLESKLRDFCANTQEIFNLLKMSGEDRRNYPRFATSLLASCKFVDSLSGEMKRTFNCELLDISRNGLCLAIRIAKKDNAKKMLGKNIAVELLSDQPTSITCFGVVVGVKFLHAATKDFTVHLELTNGLSQEQVSRVVRLGQSPS